MLVSELQLSKLLGIDRGRIIRWRLSGMIRPLQIRGNGNGARYLYEFEKVQKIVDKWR